MTVKILPMKNEHWPEVRSIYEEGIATENATFEEKPPTDWERWKENKINSCSIVAVNDNKVLGWGALSKVSERCVYGGVAEVSIYVSNEAKGKGIGALLLNSLIDISEKNNIWTLQAGIFPENEVSIQLHKKHRFKVLGVREKLGKMPYGKLKGKWRDVVLMERRSKTAGIN